MLRITELEIDGYERVARAEDEASALRAFISVHSTRLGPSLGGMRLWPYASEDAALEDVLRLSRAMTYKSAVAGTGLGGGKSVIIADPRIKSDALFEAMGRFVEDFAGAYITAEDVNVGIPDLRSVRRTTSHVTGLSVEEGGGGNPRAATALGCFLGVSAALLEGTGRAELSGKTVAVQGLGSVGYGLAEHLVRAGARLVVADVNPERLARTVAELGAEVVTPDEIYDVECDVLAPCALGGVLNDDTIPRLCCPVVAGAANNQLLDERRHGEMLRERGITYAPDYVINAGGVINISCELRPGGYDPELAVQRVHEIPQTLARVFARSREHGMTTHAAAQELAEAALAQGSR
ncbi:MAG: leucine dehydrogenase [Actinomycetota bacterium]|nr:leucine dehydrogenase [Actinomycetota bacterium]